MPGSTEIGKKGEGLAANYLISKGYRIISYNWRFKHKEIDILAWDDKILVVVEVKLRSSDYYGDPSEFVNKKKQGFLIEAAEAYLETISADPEVRLDIISILGEEGNFKIEHLADAFNP